MLDDWERRYPNCKPVGYQLRDAFPERWVRFHSSPGSKRYPEDEAEYAEVLSRHNRVLGSLTRPGESVVLVTTSYSESPEPVRAEFEGAALDPLAVPWRTLPMHETDGFPAPSFWHLHAGRHAWEPGTFDPLVRLIASDAVGNVLIVAEDCRWVLHPYDGGMDVIAVSVDARDQLRSRFRSWLSARPDGL